MANAAVMAIAHRGASAEAPENTVAAFDEAIRLGARAVEMDVRLCKDGLPVILHDATVDRTTNGTGAVADLTWFDLLRLDAGSWKHPRFAGTRIAMLTEALQAVVDDAIPVLELKTWMDPAMLRRLLEEFGVCDRAVILSFESDILQAIHRLLPRTAMGLLRDEWTPELPQLCATLGAEILALDTGVLTVETVSAAQKRHLRVWTYAPNDAGTIAACTAIGVEGIITDHPELIRPVTKRS
ncbi:MAG: glycerophosphodiester phosphodiesterase [Phycisphaerae bacterium]